MKIVICCLLLSLILLALSAKKLERYAEVNLNKNYQNYKPSEVNLRQPDTKDFNLSTPNWNFGGPFKNLH